MAFATHPEARRLFGVAIETLGARILQPPPELTLSAWAEANRILGVQATEKGAYRLSRVPYLREIMDAFTDPEVREMVILKSARLGVTEGLINTAIGYVIDQDPGNILVVWPTKDDAQEWSKETLPELFELTTCLRGKVADVETRSADNTILHKRFAGGFLTAIGSNSPRALRRRNARFVFVDEYDALDEKATTKEGDVGRRAARRAQNSPDAKIIFTGTPRGAQSRIIRDFQQSDQRHYLVPCPKCGHRQELIWNQVRWPKDLDPTNGKALKHHTARAHYVCVHCDREIHEGRQKREMMLEGLYVARNPGADVRGWKITTLNSLFVGWSTLANEYVVSKRALESGDAEKRIEFMQQVLAEPYGGPTLEKPDAAALTKRRETYAADVPAGVGVLTAGVDVQGDRLELLIKGWGLGQESWDIGHWRIYGDPDDDDVWKRLDILLFQKFAHALGADLRVQCCLVDSGDKAERVYRYCRRRHSLRVYPAKGEKTKKGRPLVWRSKTGAQVERLWFVDDGRLKRTVLNRLRIPEPGPGYIHFPGPGNDGLDDEYLTQFENEVFIPVPKPDGTTEFAWKKLGDNEAIDLQKYALAALHVLGDAVVNNLPQHVERMAAAGRVRGGPAARALDVPAGAPPTDLPKPARSRVRSRGIQ